MTFTWTRTLLRCAACGASWETPKDEPHECAVMAARSQADALAEALEDLCGWIDAAVEACDINTAAEARNTARSRLASIRSSSSTETEG